MYYRFFPTIINGFAYHYTSVEGILGILKSNTFRLTRWNLLNDINELKYGKEYSLKLLGQLNFDDEYVSKQVYAQNPELFVLSFTKANNGDSVNHWLMYGQQGEGVCLKIDVEALINSLSQIGKDKFENPEVFIGDMCYVENEYHAKLLSIWRGLNADQNLPKKEVPGQFFANVLSSLPFVKSMDFQMEDELRIYSTERLGEPISDGEKISIPFSSDFIEEIIIGPKICNGNSDDYNFNEIELELTGLIGRKDIIKKSTAPLR